jgi:hypothetical protein
VCRGGAEPTSVLECETPLAASLLIRPDELRVLEDVPLHGGFELRLRRPVQVRQLHVERVELVVVPTLSDWLSPRSILLSGTCGTW